MNSDFLRDMGYTPVDDTADTDRGQDGSDDADDSTPDDSNSGDEQAGAT